MQRESDKCSNAPKMFELDFNFFIPAFNYFRREITVINGPLYARLGSSTLLATYIHSMPESLILNSRMLTHRLVSRLFALIFFHFHSERSDVHFSCNVFRRTAMCSHGNLSLVSSFVRCFSLLQPSSACVERAFWIVNRMFDDQQAELLQGSLQTTIMLSPDKNERAQTSVVIPANSVAENAALSI